MSTNIVRVVAAVVDTTQLTLYREDGHTITILQGDPRLAKIVDDITPILSAGGIAEVDLGGTAANPYLDFEQLSGAFVKLFMIAKQTLEEVLRPKVVTPVAPVSLGAAPPMIPVIPVGGLPAAAFIDKTPVTAEQAARNDLPATPMLQGTKIQNAVAEIMANATPVSSAHFDESRTEGNDSSDTVVAVIGDKVIAGVEKLKPQLARAVTLGSTKGVDAFLRRAAAVADQRRHSIDDLLKFMERGDLPIAEDGSIVIYKVLRRKPGVKGAYLDCHTRKVTQRVGSYVCMDPSLVDHNRSNECSNGLHVARRKYIGGFGGDVVVLGKVAPEDVIAVPNYDANKMRVCGYHILFELSDDAFTKLKRNEAFTDTEEAQLVLGRALSGDHVGRLEEVRITQHQGEGVVITPLMHRLPGPPAASSQAEKPVKAEALVEEAKVDRLTAPPVDPKAVSKDVAKAKADAESRAAKAQRLWQTFAKAKSKAAKAEAAQILLDHKKSTKLGWTALGLSADSGDKLQKAIG